MPLRETRIGSFRPAFPLGFSIRPAAESISSKVGGRTPEDDCPRRATLYSICVSVPKSIYKSLSGRCMTYLLFQGPSETTEVGVIADNALLSPNHGARECRRRSAEGTPERPPAVPPPRQRPC